MIDLADLYVTTQAHKSMIEAARCAVPYETGGILIGWREGHSVSVLDSLVVAQAARSRSRFRLDPSDVDGVLANYLDGITDPRLGYVGSWHSHPVLSPPSLTDRVTFGLVSMGNPNSLAFLVVATDGRTAQTFPTVVRPGRVLRPLTYPVISERIRP